MEILMLFLWWYVLPGLIFLGITSIVRGFAGEQIISSDIRDAIGWPFSLLTIIGSLARLIYEKVKR